MFFDFVKKPLPQLLVKFHARRVGFQIGLDPDEILVLGRELILRLRLPEHRKFRVELDAQDIGELDVLDGLDDLAVEGGGGDL